MPRIEKRMIIGEAERFIQQFVDTPALNKLAFGADNLVSWKRNKNSVPSWFTVDYLEHKSGNRIEALTS